MLIPHVTGLLFEGLGEARDTDIKKLKNFVLSRRAADGGFAFCKPLPSSLPETYYAVYVLKAISAEIFRREEPVKLLNGSIKIEPYAIFYTFNCLKLLEEKLSDLSSFLLRRLKEILERFTQPSRIIDYYRGTTATYSFNLPSILREICIISCSLRLLGKNIPDDVKDFVEKFRKEGGFGVSSPSLQEVYYCLYILYNRIEEGNDVISFIRQHECPTGSFTKSPGGYPPYLEETYYSLLCLKVLGFRYLAHRCRKILKYIASLQIANGGFRRSIYGGISTLEDTYYAIVSLRILKEMQMVKISGEGQT